MGTALHAAEDLLGALRSRKAVADPVMFDALLETIDASERWIESIASTGKLPASAAQEGPRLAAVLKAAAQGEPEAATVAPTATAWVATLLRSSTNQSGTHPATALRYVPTKDCFLRDRDPLLLVRSIPKLLALGIERREPWPANAFDPHYCNMIIDVLSGAFTAELRPLFHGEDVTFVDIAEQGQAAQDKAQPSRPEQSEGSGRTVRVDAGRIDALVDLVGELVVAKNSLGQLSANAANSQLAIAPALASAVAGFERLTGEMHGAAMAMRMTPLARTLGRFPRWMRETAAKLGKEVQFDIVDAGTEADKTVVDGLFEPLLHVLRNAVDHGIEEARSREAAGKPPKGRIILEARPQGDQIVISVRDDGAGLDIATIRQAAKRKGILSEEAIDALDDAAAADLIFMPGFSTANTVTDISGRGVGMDAVRAAITALGGRVSMSSRLGAGTTILMSLPRAIQISQVVTVEVGNERFGVPIENVSETCRIAQDRILPIRSGEAFVLRNRTLPLLRLSELLRLQAPQRRDGDAKVLIVALGDQRVGVEVDGVGERLDVLLRPMSGLLASMRGVLGTALLGDGGVLLVLDLPELTS
jgi:two-component system chemotaxis sensor kinase CheA